MCRPEEVEGEATARAITIASQVRPGATGRSLRRHRLLTAGKHFNSSDTLVTGKCVPNREVPHFRGQNIHNPNVWLGYY